MHSEEESESDSDLSMGSEEPDSRAASPQLDDIKGERWALKKYSDSADNAVCEVCALFSGCIGKFVHVCNTLFPDLTLCIFYRVLWYSLYCCWVNLRQSRMRN